MEINIRNDALFKEMQNSCFYRLRKKEKEHKKTQTSIMLAPAGPTVLTMWTLGVEVERCLCKDWPSPPDMGKSNAGAGERSILHRVNSSQLSEECQPKLFCSISLKLVRTYPAGSGVRLLCDGKFAHKRICGYSSTQILRLQRQTKYN